MNDSVSLETILTETSLGAANEWLPIVITWLTFTGRIFYHYRSLYEAVHIYY